MSLRIRGQEATIQVIVDGDLKTGSFGKVTNFTLTPRQDVMEQDYLGEQLTDLDFQHHGYDFEFEMHNQDGKAWDVLQTIVTREADRLPHPAVNVVVTLSYRESPMGTTVILLGQCFMKMDSFGFSGRKEYVSARWSGKCKTAEEVG
jgi:hypothetical protein